MRIVFKMLFLYFNNRICTDCAEYRSAGEDILLAYLHFIHRSRKLAASVFQKEATVKLGELS